MSNINTGTTNIPIPDSAYARRRRATELIYMTAWQQSQPRDYRNPTHKEEVLNKEAVIFVTLLAALDYFIYDLIDEMTAAGKYRHANKHNINRAQAIILHAHEVFYKKIYNEDFRGCQAYNEAMEVFYGAINDCVSLEAPERAYNIIVAICRLQATQRAKLGDRYYYAPSAEVDKIPSMLAGLNIKDYALDNIIERRVRPIIFKREYGG